MSNKLLLLAIVPIVIGFFSVSYMNQDSVETKILPTYTTVALGSGTTELILETKTSILEENQQLKTQVQQSSEQIQQIKQQSITLTEKIKMLEEQLQIIGDLKSSQQVEQYQQEIAKLEAQIKELKSQQPTVAVTPTPEQQTKIAELQQKIRELEEARNQTTSESIFETLTGFEQDIQIVEQPKTPKVIMSETTITWEFVDSKNNKYTFSKLVDDFIDEVVRLPSPQDTITINLAGVGPGGSADTVEIRDLSKFVKGEMIQPMNELYNTSATPGEFLFEVWWIVSQFELTSYNMQPDPKHPLDTFSKGQGDNEDLAILMAEMIKSSDVGKNWNLKFIYFDSDNPASPKKIDHVALLVESDKDTWLIEPTAKTLEEAFQSREKIRGSLSPIS